MKITFGKFSGWNTEDLAKAGKTGRDYLYWGANNLKSEMWRREFDRAQRLQVAQDDTLAAKALLVSDPDLGMYEAQRIVSDEKAEEAERDRFVAAFDAARAAVIACWLPSFPGKTAAQLRGIAGKWEHTEWQEVPLGNFSSPAARAAFMGFMDEYTAVEIDPEAY